MVAKEENKDVQEFNRRSLTCEDSWEQWFFFDRLHKAVLDLEGKSSQSKKYCGCQLRDWAATVQCEGALA